MSTWILLLITSLSIVNADEHYTEEGRVAAWIIVVCCVVAVCVIGGIAGIVFLMKNRGSNQKSPENEFQAIIGFLMAAEMTEQEKQDAGVVLIVCIVVGVLIFFSAIGAAMFFYMMRKSNNYNHYNNYNHGGVVVL